MHKAWPAKNWQINITEVPIGMNEHFPYVSDNGGNVIDCITIYVTDMGLFYH